jgi:Arm DNA-binding domain
MAKVLRSNFKASIERRKHPENALSAVEVKSLKKPGRYGDGNGLHLVIDKSHAKHWILRTTIHGRRTDMGLGSVRLVTLAEARQEAARWRKVARQGGDPILQRRQEKEALEKQYLGRSESPYPM